MAFGQLGVGKEKREQKPWEIVNPDNIFSQDNEEVIGHRVKSFRICLILLYTMYLRMVK